MGLWLIVVIGGAGLRVADGGARGARFTFSACARTHLKTAADQRIRHRIDERSADPLQPRLASDHIVGDGDGGTHISALRKACRRAQAARNLSPRKAAASRLGD